MHGSRQVLVTTKSIQAFYSSLDHVKKPTKTFTYLWAIRPYKGEVLIF